MTNSIPLSKVKYYCLEGRNVFISGGATGIGKSLVEDFAKQGSVVGFVDITAKEGQALADGLNEHGHQVEFTQCDITETQNYQTVIQDFIERNGPCKALLNNAANDTRHGWSDVTPEQFNKIISVNLKHSFFAIQTVLPSMIDSGGGSIINFGSSSWYVGSQNLPVYGTSKAGVHGMTRCFATDLGKHNIRVNTIVPGWIMTQRQLDLWVDEKAEETLDQNQRLAGRILPEDVSALSLFLASDQSRMCSAQNFIVDAGWI
ncbi:MAG: SDR family NAD(P)-dependent oxidoreductase [Rhodobacteraceae bacterium]|nr:SDR family NAD(P)-dependent oxidoreductase [Paracoccaceae bacterium]MCY4250722.1 SDR family NAD(P)-dependent oxidoreductase [Paracoccaceae bacterium]MCY4306788.1 SDR family NAD(P)-dependent oxidoreductase [Paracoccaceae bacterium]